MNVDLSELFDLLKAEVGRGGITATAEKIGLTQPGLRTVLKRGYFSTTNSGKVTIRKVAEALGEAEPDEDLDSLGAPALRLKTNQAEVAGKRAKLLDIEIQAKAGKLVEAERLTELATAVGVSIRKNFEGLRREIHRSGDETTIELVDDYYGRLVSDVKTKIKDLAA